MTKKEQFVLLDDLEKKLSKILQDLIDKDIEISPYNLELIKQKLEVIETTIKNNISNENKKDNSLSAFEKLELKKYVILLALTLCIALFAPGLFPLILLFSFNFNNKPPLPDDFDTNELKRLFTMVSNEIQNCKTFINVRNNAFTININKLINSKMTEFDFANFVIYYYMQNLDVPTYYLNDLDNNIKDIIINILQADLNTTIDNIESLMIFARGQIALETTLEQAEYFIRKRKKSFN